MIFLNGELLPPERACIAPTDRGLLLGDGLFETMRARSGRALFLVEHLARLRRGSAVLGIPVPGSDEELAEAVRRTLAANGLGDADAGLRLTLTRGSGPRGLAPPPEPRPTLMIAALPLASGPHPPARAVLAGPRRNEHSPLCAVKSLCCLDNVLAQRQALAAGADEALLCNTGGRLCEAASANLFMARDGLLRTPPLGDGPLAGIVRAVVIELAGEMGLAVAEASLAPADFARADEAFLTNSLIGVRPLVMVDGRPIGDGGAGPLTGRLQAAYASRTGERPAKV